MKCSPREAMALAIEEAQKGLGFVAPNPPVGCVILNNRNELLAKGHHKLCGQPHAEIEALKAVTNPGLLQDAVLYVTLEPCSHKGRTPSCAEALAKLPISKVIYGLEDPNPLVSGKGVEILKASGKQVQKFEGFEQELNELIEVFSYNIQMKKPFVSLKVATSLDGQMALKSGESRWITNEKSRDKGQYLRGVYDATMVGKGTFLQDRPRLNVRSDMFKDKQNKVVLVDTQGETFHELISSRLLEVHKPSSIYFVTNKVPKDIPESLVNINVVECELGSDGLVSLEKMLELLYEHDINSLYVEGGAHLLSSFLHHKLAQRMYQFIAPRIIGDVNSINWTRWLEAGSLENSLELKGTTFKTFDDNILISGRISYPNI